MSTSLLSEGGGGTSRVCNKIIYVYQSVNVIRCNINAWKKVYSIYTIYFLTLTTYSNEILVIPEVACF